MVMTSGPEIRTTKNRMPRTVRVGIVAGGWTEFVRIQDAIDYCDNEGGDWTVEIYTGNPYDEGDITTAGTADITLKGMGKDRVVIAPVAVPVTAVIVTNVNVTLENLIVTAPDATRPALSVGSGICTAVDCELNGVGAGDSIDVPVGTLNLDRCDVNCDIELRMNNTTLNATFSRLRGGINTAGALAHVMTLVQCDLNNSGVQSAATGATTLTAHGCSYMGQLANAGTGDWVCRGCDVGGVNFTGTGTLTLFGGDLGNITRATASVVWWRDASTIIVLPSGTATDGMIGYALVAAGAAGGMITIRLAEGDYTEDNLVLVDDVTLVGEGHTAHGSHITINSANPVFTAGAAVTATLRFLRITQAGAGNCINVTGAGAVVHADMVVVESTAGTAVALTNGTFSGHNSTISAGGVSLGTNACTLVLHRFDVTGNIATAADASAHTLTLEGCNLNGGNITNAATGATVIEVIKCYDVNAFTDAGLLGTVLIEATIMVTATKSGTSPWTVRIAEFGILSNTNAVGAITCYGGLVFALARAVGPIVWWQDTNTLKVIPCTTLTDTIIQWAVNAAAAGDVVVIHPGTYQEQVVMVAGVNVVGVDRDNVVIQVTGNQVGFYFGLTANNTRLANLTIEATADGAGNSIAVEVGDVICTIEDVKITLARTANDAFGIRQQVGATARTFYVRNAHISATGINTYGIAIGQAGKTAYIEESHIVAQHGLYVSAASTVYSNSNYIEGSVNSITLVAAGTISMTRDMIIGVVNQTAGTMLYRDQEGVYHVYEGMSLVNACTAAMAVGNSVRLHPGTHVLAATIVITTYNFALVGDGRDCIIQASGALNPAFDLGVGVLYATAVNSIYFAHFTLDGNDVGLIGIHGQNVLRSTFEDLEIKEWRHWGCHFGFNHSVNLLNSWIHDCGRFADIDGGTYLGGVKVGMATMPFGSLTMQGCLVEWCLDGIYIQRGASTSIRDTGIEGNGRHGIVIDGEGTATPSDIVIDGCAFELNNTGTYANVADIYGINNIYGVRIQGCCFSGGNVTWSIRLGTSGLFSSTAIIEGNRFVVDCPTNLYIDNFSRGVRIQNNYFLTSLIIYRCPGVFPLDIAQFGYDPDMVFTTVETAATYGGSLSVYVSKGTWILSEKFTAPVGGVTIFGDGPESILKLADGVNDYMLYAAIKSNITIRDLAIDGNRANNAAADPVYLYQCSHCSLRNLTIYECDDYGIRLRECTYIEVRACYVHDCDIHGLYMLRCSYCDVDGGKYNDNGGDGIHVAGDATANSDYNILRGIHAHGNTSDGIEISEVGAGQANKNIVDTCQLLGNTGLALNDGGTATVTGDNVVA